MSTFILWIVSFISSPGATTELPPSIIPLVSRTDCPRDVCGLNGTRITGLARAADVTSAIRTITLPAGELVTLR